MRKILFVATTVTVVLVAGAVPAWAHEEINPSSFPIGKPVFLTLKAANEKQADLTKITLTAPAGLGFGEGTREPAGWTVSATSSAITWTGGTVTHGHFEEWGFEVESARQPGTFTYKVTLGFANGETEDANVPVTAVAAGTAPTTAAPTPTAAVTTSVATTTPTTEAKESDTASTRANIALGLGVVAVALSAIALGMAARRRKTNGADSADVAGDKQDW